MVTRKMVGDHKIQCWQIPGDMISEPLGLLVDPWVKVPNEGVIDPPRRQPSYLWRVGVPTGTAADPHAHMVEDSVAVQNMKTGRTQIGLDRLKKKVGRWCAGVEELVIPGNVVDGGVLGEKELKKLLSWPVELQFGNVTSQDEGTIGTNRPALDELDTSVEEVLKVKVAGEVEECH